MGESKYAVVDSFWWFGFVAGCSFYRDAGRLVIGVRRSGVGGLYLGRWRVVKGLETDWFNPPARAMG